MAFAAKNGPADLRMKRDLVVLAAIVANYVEPFWGFVIHACLLRATFCTTLRRHHVALVKHLLFLFSEQKDLLTLHTRNFYVRHR